MHCEGMTSVNLGAAAAVFMPSVGPASMSAHALQGPQPWWLQNMTLSKLKVWDRQLYSVVYFQSGWQLWKLCSAMPASRTSENAETCDLSERIEWFSDDWVWKIWWEKIQTWFYRSNFQCVVLLSWLPNTGLDSNHHRIFVDIPCLQSALTDLALDFGDRNPIEFLGSASLYRVN